MQGAIFSHTEIQLGAHFDKEIGWVVVIRQRAWPDQCTDWQIVYTKLSPYNHPPLFSHPRFSTIQLSSLLFTAFGPSPEHDLSFARLHS